MIPHICKIQPLALRINNNLISHDYQKVSLSLDIIQELEEWEDLREWCENEFGPNTPLSINQHDETPRWKYQLVTRNIHSFYFRDQEDLVLFKLTWLL